LERQKARTAAIRVTNTVRRRADNWLEVEQLVMDTREEWRTGTMGLFN
jgi:hypothetical protein